MSLLKRQTALSALLLFALTAAAQNNFPSTGWVGSWATSQQIPEPQNALPADDLRDATIREIIHLSVGGSAFRVHLSNAFGTAPLHIAAAHIARPLSPAAAKIDPASDRALTFDGRPDIIIPAGAEYISDPINQPLAPLSDLAITLYLETPPAVQTGHPGSRATTYTVHGNQVSAPDLPDAKKVDHWYMISGLDVTLPNASAVIALGDSITDGHGATTNGNDRWTDILAQRLQASPDTRAVAVLNHGIGGNHILTDGLGPSALARFDRDVLAQTGARTLIVFEAVNDLGGLTRLGPAPAADHAELVRRILAAYQQMILRAHAHGIKVIGATITPYGGSGYYHPDGTNEADRQAINDWIRAAGHFDAVIDFDKAVRDPAQPDHLQAAFDCGDHLHPSPAGYKAMAESIPLALLR
jgi:lysophospholipase L1-like esterase